jgi:hypothetical protein
MCIDDRTATGDMATTDSLKHGGPIRRGQGAEAHGGWPAGNGTAIPSANCPCRPGGALTGEGSNVSQYRSVSAPAQE